jgi:hypothetical protein
MTLRMLRHLVFVGIALAFLFQVSQVDAHFFGATRQVDQFQVIFAPYPDTPIAGSNSTYLNFSVLENGSNIFNIHSAVVISAKDTGTPVGQIPYRQYEFSDISIPYVFSDPGSYTVTLQTRITGNEKYQAMPLEASFDIAVDSMGRQGVPIEELMLYYVTPAGAAIAGIAIYLHSKGKL